MPDNRQLEILSDLLKTAERNFEATVKHAATIDDKAQKTSALAGVLVAFGFIKPEGIASLQQHFGSLALLLLYLTLVLLVIAVLLCLRAMWLRKVPVGGISVSAHEESARIVMSFGDIDDEIMAAYRENQLQVWKRAIAERHEANVQKTRLVHYAQRVLALTIVVAVVTLGLLGYTTLRIAVPSKQEQQMPGKGQNPPAKNKTEVKRSGRELAVAKAARAGESVGVDGEGNTVALYVTAPTLRSNPAAKYEALQRLHSPSLIAQQVAMLDRLE